MAENILNVFSWLQIENTALAITIYKISGAFVFCDEALVKIIDSTRFSNIEVWRYKDFD